MEDYRLNHNLARQPYLINDPEVLPQEDDNLVPLKPTKQRSLDSIAEAELTPRSATKRKQSSAAQAKGRSSASQQKTMKALRQQAATLQPYAEELKRLEDQAERINQLLTERSQKRAWMDHSQSLRGMGVAVPGLDPRSVAPGTQPSVPGDDTESLRLYAQRIHQRAVELEAAIAIAATTPSPNPETFYSDRDPAQPPVSSKAIRSYAPPFQPKAPAPIPQYSYPQSLPARPRQDLAQPSSSQPVQGSETQNFNWQQQADYQAQLAAEELRQLSQRSQPMQSPQGRSPVGYACGSQPDWVGPSRVSPRYRPRSAGQNFRRGRSGFSLQRFLTLRFSEVASNPIELIGNAAVWVAVAAIARVASRYLLSSVPLLAPVFLLLLLTPAILAVFLAFFVPRARRGVYYRLFLITLGLLIGGKL